MIAGTRSYGRRLSVAIGMALGLVATSALGVFGLTAKAHAAPTPCASSARACMSLSAHRAWLTDGAGHVVYGPVPAHGGPASAPTPAGTFQVIGKDAHFYSTQFHAPMPYSVFFYPGDAFHADNPATASNGCIHLSAGAAQRFFNTLRMGDQVQIVR
ncbi:MAG: L,D-transpeptidase [Pseudonocardia sp.]|nr:L,D-transpeptidase [Pseudonocardia sp.]